MVTATFVVSGWGDESWLSSAFGLLAIAVLVPGVAAATLYRQSKRQQAAESEQLLNLWKALDESAIGDREIAIRESDATAMRGNSRAASMQRTYAMTATTPTHREHTRAMIDALTNTASTAPSIEARRPSCPRINRPRSAAP